MINTDLHIHSIHSNDGELPINEIIEMCIKQKIGTFSITDHNTVKGLNQAAELAQQKGLDFIPGIEIDCQYKGINLHVLGYNINLKSGDFYRLEDQVSEKVMDSFAEMINNINKQGFIIDADSVLEKAQGILPSGELIAEVMLSDEKYYTPKLLPYMSGGERSDMPYLNFYMDYLAQGKPAYVHIDYMSYAEAIEIIKDNGGIPIVAHPGLNLKGKENLVQELLKSGAEGLEVFNNYHEPDQIDYLAAVVQNQNSLITCGSDFHGKIKPSISIGEYKFDSRYEQYLKSSIDIIKK